MSELKNCPHCNKVMTPDNFYSEDGYPQGCHCWEECNTSEQAEEIWNTRPIESALEAENERLRTAMDKVYSKVDTLSQLIVNNPDDRVLDNQVRIIKEAKTITREALDGGK